METTIDSHESERGAETKLMLLFASGERARAAKGTPLFRAGDTPLGAYLITAGRIRLTLEDRRKREMVARTVGVGEVLGLEPVFSGEPVEFTATAISDCRFDFVAREHLLRALAADPALFIAALQLLSRDVVALYDAVREKRATTGAVVSNRRG